MRAPLNKSCHRPFLLQQTRESSNLLSAAGYTSTSASSSSGANDATAAVTPSITRARAAVSDGPLSEALLRAKKAEEQVLGLLSQLLFFITH